MGGLTNKENHGMHQVLHSCLCACRVYSKTYKTLVFLSDPNVYDFQIEGDIILRMVIFFFNQFYLKRRGWIQGVCEG